MKKLTAPMLSALMCTLVISVSGCYSTPEYTEQKPQTYEQPQAYKKPAKTYKKPKKTYKKSTSYY